MITRKIFLALEALRNNSVVYAFQNLSLPKSKETALRNKVLQVHLNKEEQRSSQRERQRKSLSAIIQQRRQIHKDLSLTKSEPSEVENTRMNGEDNTSRDV
ncbi:uncharacterized protein PHA67_020513 [Liasis olivaceus]